jgi:hypothetical protein
MAKATHPADDFEAKVIAEADHWTAFQMRGPRAREKSKCSSREEARAEGLRMVREHPSKPAMIYAVTAAGRQALAETIQPERQAR